ncbi:MAG: radical SAM protein [Desulfobulbaceae bacterium]|nr:radical SAM protein [Desulfobulbaceae bacterium]
MQEFFKRFFESWKDFESFGRDYKKVNKLIDFSPSDQEIFHIILIKPTKYDDEGFAIHWHRPYMASNTLAVVNGLARDAALRKVLGEDVEIRVSAIDENYSAPDYEVLICDLKKHGQRALVCLVGVQTNQFPRAYDVGRIFRKAEVQVSIGGFHVSGCVAMLDELPPELVAAQKDGISLFAGELEGGRLDQLLLDCWQGDVAALYSFIGSVPSITLSPIPCFTDEMIANSMSQMGSIDLGRGCPFECNFCCIISVQGRISRSRSSADLEAYVKDLCSRGAKALFITDDNFARNGCWEEHLDCLIRLRSEGLKLLVAIQVDTRCYKIPGFIEKAVAAGVATVFIGMESINSENLAAMKKRQNSINHYREMLIAWKKHPVLIIAAYIIGLPEDTRDSILMDIETIKQKLPVDLLSLSIFTPLPGSELHREMLNQGVWMDPDLNKYDLAHRVIKHTKMADKELDDVYQEAYNRFYEFEHMKTIMKRSFGLGSNRKKGLVNLLLGYGVMRKVWGITSIDIGWKRYLSIKNTRGGRSSLQLVWLQVLAGITRNFKFFYICYQYLRINSAMLKIWNDPKRLEYQDEAIKEQDQKRA